MPKDDLANSRLDLAPKLNRPLSLWNPNDYLRFAYWVLFFPQAIRWYLDTFSDGPIDISETPWKKTFEILTKNSTLRTLIFLAVLIVYIPVGVYFFIYGRVVIESNQNNLESLRLLAWLSFLVPLLFFLITESSTQLKGFNAITELSRRLALGIVFGIRIQIISSFFGGIIGVFDGSFLKGFILATLLVLLVWIPLLALSLLSCIRLDAWILGVIMSFLRPGIGFSSIASATPIIFPSLERMIQDSLCNDWESGVHDANQLLLYSKQATSVVWATRKHLDSLPENQLFSFMSYLTESLSDWTLIKFLSTSMWAAVKLEFFSALRLTPWQNKPFFLQKLVFYTNTPTRAAAAGFWHLHEEQPAQAAQAFSVVLDIRHGEEMHGLASLLALFDAAEAVEQIAAIELPDLPCDRTLRPHTWEAIRRFCHVVSDTKTAQASASRTARAFATNRALGELQHIIEYEADLPEAERSLVIEIAKTWRNALLEITAEVGEINLTQPVQNPYVIGDPVEGDLFVGRDDIMRQLQELWLMGNHLQSVVIYGHRRMGKTSILKNIESRLGSGIHVAYVNLLKSAGADDLSDVLLAISDQVATTLAIAPPRDSDMATSPSRTFERFLSRATNSLANGKGLIIALDEFEKIEELIEAGKLEASFMAYLRGLVQDSPRVGFAFAGLHTLQEMSADYFQPFFASVIPIKVDFFRQGTVQSLLPNPGGDFPLDYDYDALDLIWHLTAGQPYLTQLLGFQLVRRYNDQVFERQQPRDPKFTVADVQTVVEHPEFFAQGKPYFAGVWAQASHDAPGQQAILNTLAPHPEGLALGDLQAASELNSDTFSAALDTLQNHDVVRLSGDQAKIIVEVFRRWVLTQPA